MPVPVTTDTSEPKRSLEPIRFGEFMLERRAISDEQWLDALAEHWAQGERIGTTIARRGFLSADQVEALAADYHELQVVEVDLEVGA
jgi:hypothetical protein